ncbi:hypothetical protein [Enterococcus sp. AZ102]|uniref:hypothetical protein n=1 Tax=Enterococcus sp. AZ102 TaxID=2774865 RepID=UPI003F27D914
MKTLTLNQVISLMQKEQSELFEKHGIDKKEDNFTVMQPLANGQGVLISVSEDDEEEEKRTLKVKVTDAMIALEPIDAVLDIFEED